MQNIYVGLRMNKINRSTFLKQSAKAGALLLIRPMPEFFSTHANRLNEFHDEALMKRIVSANDAQVEKLLATDLDNRAFSRRVASDFAMLTASYCSPSSRYYHGQTVF